MKLAANLSMMYQEWSFLDRVSKAAEDGFEWVECMFPYEVTAGALSAAAQAAGVQFILINAPAGNWLAGDRGLAHRTELQPEFKAAIDQAAEYADVLGVKQVHVLAGCAKPENHPVARQCYRDNLQWACEHTAQLPLKWNIEPINTRDVPNYLLTHQAQAHALVEQLGHDRLQVQMDLYHCQIMEGDITRSLERWLPTGRVGHIQIASVPCRHEPNTGELNDTHVFQTLHQLGWTGYIGCEYWPQTSTRDGLIWRERLNFSGTM